jgi:hypothetical protein
MPIIYGAAAVDSAFFIRLGTRLVCLEENHELIRDLIGSPERRYGGGISNCLQILRTVKSGISRCRGTAVRRPFAGFSQIE